ncbi:MAG: hypothetical protein AAFY48_09675 [Bacteroidota bacterium]
MRWITEKNRPYQIIVVCALVLGCHLLTAQSGLVFGLTGHHLVTVNVENGELTPLHKLEGLPADAELRNLVYIAKDQAFYTTMNFRSNPSLLRIRATGDWEIVGVLEMSGSVLYFCEALTYDPGKDQLLVSASLDGAIPQDKKSEAILIVDRQTARCQLAATIRQNPSPDDFDEIAVFEGRLFGMDGVPHMSTTYIYPFNLDHLDGRELFAGTKQNIPYFTMDDVVVIGHLLYFPDAKTQGWYFFDLRGRRWYELGKVHGPASLGKIKLTGLAYLPLSQA